ncbi:hypothetical protein PP304_gp051 [Gordonia phage Phendrix]|uniref:Uncharacterized protein n=1 Tax=Gordonia phage Phendrix TaxID=2593335 RepID=A0A514U0X5_9CAUD|nr:hypothetical protein PP304_gp051 [Gordonia phage Phendrix]QDK02599.1 hypothetical protein SEA_PHENDRIX_51 [Gordonia phage Phendrix]
MRTTKLELKSARQIKIARVLLTIAQIMSLAAATAPAALFAMWACHEVPYLKQWGFMDWWFVIIVLAVIIVSIKIADALSKLFGDVDKELGVALEQHVAIEEAIKRGDKAAYDSKGQLIMRIDKEGKPLE